jgi:hypothetical protein
MGRRLEVPDSSRRGLYVGEGLLPAVLHVFHWSELDFYDWGIRLQGGTLLKRLGECYEFRYEELAEAKLDGIILGCVPRRCVVFSTKLPPQPRVFFLTKDGHEILDHLERRSVPRNRNGYDRPSRC